MYFINSKPTVNGNYGNPQSNSFDGSVALPDALLSDYIAAKGFVMLAIDDGSVSAVMVNQEALDVYMADHPDTSDEPEPTEVERLEAQVMYTALMTDTLLEEE